MDIQRTIAFIVFFTCAFLLWEGWQKQHIPPQSKNPILVNAPTASNPPSVSSSDTPMLTKGQPSPQTGVISTGERIKIQTDKLSVEIDTAGGDLRNLILVEHLDVDDKSQPIVLMKDKGEPFYITQSGLLGADLPNHNTIYTATAPNYRLETGQDKLVVNLIAPEVKGVKVEKIYTFHRGSYVVDIAYSITNTGTSSIAPDVYYQFLRDGVPPPGQVKMLNTFTGPAIYTDQDKFVKIHFSDIDKGKEAYSKKANNGWIGMVQHYFVAAWLPPAKTEREFYTKKIGDKLYAAGVILPAGTIEPGKTAVVDVPLYAGPQEVDKLTQLAPGLGLVVDFGWLTIIAAPLFKVMHFIYSWVNNWGVAIILLTVLIKSAFYPLQNKAARSMAQMKVLGPKMQKLKEQYGDDRQKLQQAMMELYRKEKINPLGGCLPIMIQIPVFIALYWVLLANVELRHAPFILWIKDLSAADPYFILPVLYGLKALMKVENGKVKTVPVKLGARADGYVEVLSGVAEGDEVVARAGTFVADGDMVTPVRGEQTGAIN